MKKLHFTCVTLLLAIFAGTLLTGCGMSKKKVAETVARSFLNKLNEDEDRREMNIRIGEVSLVKVDKTHYTGSLEMFVFDKGFDIDIDVVADGKVVKWQTETSFDGLHEAVKDVQYGPFKLEYINYASSPYFSILGYDQPESEDHVREIVIPIDAYGIPISHVSSFSNYYSYSRYGPFSSEGNPDQVLIIQGHTTGSQNAFSKLGFGEVEINEPMKKLPTAWFARSPNLKKVTLPNTLTTIEDGVFQFCTKLETINLDNVTQIYSSAFEGCTSLDAATRAKITAIVGRAVDFDREPFKE
jgi:hypothetical protein